jgi:anti-anti-sigma regulatory factor
MHLGSTGMELVVRYADALRARGGDLLLAGVSAGLRDELARTGMTAYLGADHIFTATDTYFESTEAALAAARGLTSRA